MLVYTAKTECVRYRITDDVRPTELYATKCMKYSNTKQLVNKWFTDASDGCIYYTQTSMADVL